MKNITVKGKRIKIALFGIMVFILVFLMGSIVYIQTTYSEIFSGIDKPDPNFSGYLRYSDIDEYERTKIEFESGKNVLKGYIYGGKNDIGLVVISHGLGYGAENYLAETIYFVDNGWRVFAFDNTGTHDSEGKSTIGPSQSLLDLKAAVTFIKNNNELNNLDIMLYGHSWGAYAVCAILDDNFDIAAVTSIAGFNSPMELLKEQADSQLGLVAPIEYPVLWIQQNILFGKTSRVTATEGINSKDTPVMVIHGDKDEAISYYGAGIIAHQADITNPNVIYKTYSAENHNGHNNLFKSNNAIEYIKEKNLEYEEIYEKFKGEIPDDVRVEYYQGIDRFQTSELDLDFMNAINHFFELHLSSEKKQLAFVYQENTIAISDIVDDQKIESMLGKADEIKTHTFSESEIVLKRSKRLIPKEICSVGN